ncbi:MAG: hypothetical protein ACXVEF_13920 [Polyangiales bacterium]
MLHRRRLAFFLSSFLASCSGGTAGVEDPGGPIDTGTIEDTSIDTGSDTGSDDTSVDTGTDTGPDDTGVIDSGSDTGPFDTGIVDTGTDTASPTDCTLDSDGDGIPDGVEGRFATPPTDTDSDGTPDYLDDDSDGDGIKDKDEWFDKASCSPTGGNDADGDGIPNFRDKDSDGNGLDDKDEVCPPAAVLSKLGKPACVPGTPYDFDGDGAPDFLDPDDDHDSKSTDKTIGLDDSFELKDSTGTYVGLVDTDGDGIPDLYDTDSDGDGILDAEDGLADVDKDGKQNFRDLDSDGDGVPDACEKTVDTDGDGKSDYVDLDSDGDLLPDALEDKNGSCTVDSGETDRLKKDTDGDGHEDLVEVTLTPSGDPSWATDPSKTPWNQGKFYFIEPYSMDGSAKPYPASTPLALSTTLNQGDVAFVVDTTFSMQGIEGALSSSIASKIIPGLATKIPDLQVGVIGYDDALAKPWGDQAGDSFIWFPNGGDASKGSWVTPTMADAIAAANGLTKTSGGGSFPEGSILALWWAITNDNFAFASCTGCSPVPPTTSKSFTSPTVTAPFITNRYGGMRFRKDSLPIVIQSSDANMHGGLSTDCIDGVGVRATPCFPIAYETTAAVPTSLGHSPVISEVKDKLNSVGAKYIGVSVHGTGGTITGRSSFLSRTVDPTKYSSSLDMLYLARNTGSKVPPSVLGGTATNCKTSNPGAANNAPDADGLCPLVFDVSYDGTGLGDTVVSAVVALVNALKFDVHVEAKPVISGGVDPVDAFMTNVLPMTAGATDPVTMKTCIGFSAALTEDRYSGPKATAGTDGAKETMLGLTPGPLYCFAVAGKPNTTVAATSVPQIFKANLGVIAEKPKPPAGPGGTFTLGADREVLFIVPPIVN